MNPDPWTDAEPQPGDFDLVLAEVDPADIEVHEGDPDARVVILGSTE